MQGGMLDRASPPWVSVSEVLLVIDNYDSFTFNLVQYFGQLGVEQRIYRNNEITPAEALALNPERVLLSPGPCSPLAVAPATTTSPPATT